MKLILGVGIVGKAAIEYFKTELVCFYDEIFNEYIDKSGNYIPFFSSWDEIDSVIVSPSFTSDHPMIIEARNRDIKIETDISIFLQDPNMPGIKIGVTGTNGKSTLCALLKHILGDLAEIGGNFGVSPLKFVKNSFYIIELSSYQLFWLSEDVLKNLDIGVITNISNHHLAFHKTKKEYNRVKDKILNAKHNITNTDLHEEVQYPKNKLFEHKQYKLAWKIILKIIGLMNLDEKKASQKLESYVPLKYRQEVINDSPLVINDSKSTNVESMCCAIENMRKGFILISQINNYEKDDLNIYQYPLLNKIFILSNKDIENLKIPYYISNDFQSVVKEALVYAKDNELGVLFSPGEQSFEFFKNFEERGEIFANLVNESLKKKG